MLSLSAMSSVTSSEETHLANSEALKPLEQAEFFLFLANSIALEGKLTTALDLEQLDSEQLESKQLELGKSSPEEPTPGARNDAALSIRSISTKEDQE